MRILGIDPGTSLIGYGVVETTTKNCRAVAFGDFRTPPGAANSHRVVPIYDFFLKLIKKYRPQKLAVESLFFFKNQKTATAVSEIRGIIILAAAKCGLDIVEFTPLQVKQAVSGYGRADKGQVQQMVKLILGLDQIPKPDDTADALAIAICCANTVRY